MTRYGRPSVMKPFLEFAGLKAGAHENGDLAQPLSFALQRLDLVADPACLLDAVP